MLPVAESDFPELVLAHEAAFVNIASHAVDASLTCVLPHGDVSSVG